MQTEELLRGLPGEELIRGGLNDVEQGRVTMAACLIAIALPRLRRAGLVSSTEAVSGLEGELTLYRLLQQEPGDAYGRYNALLRQLVSFERALDHRLARLG